MGDMKIQKRYNEYLECLDDNITDGEKEESCSCKEKADCLIITIYTVCSIWTIF